MKPSDGTSGIVYNVQRFSLHDGPGIRTIVFLKGCPLRCLWCANPESQQPQPQPMGAETAGREMTVDEVLDIVARDKVFYKTSGGGMTLSGGEPLAQAEFSAALVAGATRREISVAVETSGYAGWDELWRVVEHVELVFLDIKVMDSGQHRLYTGAPNELILNNARRLAECQKNVVVRVPVVPGHNDNMENLVKTCEFCSDIGVRRLELLPYHRLGESKYEKLNIPYALKGIAPQPKAQFLDLVRQLQQRVRIEVAAL